MPGKRVSEVKRLLFLLFIISMNTIVPIITFTVSVPKKRAAI